MNIRTIVFIVLTTFITGCSSSGFLKKISPFKSEEPTLEPQKGTVPANREKSEEIFVCAGDIDTTYKKLGEVSLGEFGFSGHDVLALKIKEKAQAVGAQAVINVQYDTGASKSWQGYGELGGTDYGVKHTSWCKGTAIVFLESYNPLGLLVCNITKENKEWFGFKKKQHGVLIVHSMPESTAANAGIRVEDLLTEWNSEKIEDKKHLKQLIETHAGKEVKLTLLREKEIRMITLSVPTSEASRIVLSPPNPFKEEQKLAIENTAKKEASPVKLSANTADIHNEVGDLYLRKGMYDEAMKEYKKAIEIDPNCAIAHFNLSIVYDKKGMKEKADEEFATYKRLKPKNKFK
ncbi:MAG: tetratricopeptide repeat protein [Candidatus Jettenia sp. CY-1]|nr:MAG: tetratricopeptide repeat protein [Candidatus Jettenia sp. CY-1]